MDIQQIKELMTQLEESKLTKLIFKKGDFELHLEKEPANLPAPRSRVVSIEAESAFQSEVPLKGERGGSVRVDAPGTYVTSPMVGTYYSCPAPGQPSFVKVGDTVDANTVVCIVEAMKVMNEVKAGISGIVAEILNDHSQPVEFGTRLLRIT
jgi:acetyl-CoA carboxylase biotin carboxyl carrier protein